MENVPPLNVKEAMKVLNMKKFNAEELNDKFRFRVQSVAHGLGGPLSKQKHVYTAWEYLNRMLAREASTRTEEVLQKADTTVRIVEKRKKLDMIPFRLNSTRKGSLIIEKDPDVSKIPTRPAVASILKEKTLRKEEKVTRIESYLTTNVSALHGILQCHKRVRWSGIESLKTAVRGTPIIKDPPKPQFRNVPILRSTPSKVPAISKKDTLAKQLKEIMMNVGNRWHSPQDRRELKTEKKPKGKLLLDASSKLPKIPTLVFKRLPVLNEMYAKPKKLSKHDQRSLVRRTLWKEKSALFLCEPDGKLEDEAACSQNEEVKIMRGNRMLKKSLQKQQELLYGGFSDGQSEDVNHKIAKLETGMLTRSTLESKQVDTKDMVLTTGQYTSERIKNWIESATHWKQE